ncbi:MAG: 3-keto-5-aminohexanoate cleavage protein [Gemmatimonadaceae bacterium]
MTSKVIINVAPTGMVPTTRDNTNVPVTVRAIADTCAECRAAGGAIFHLHVRAPDESADYRAELYHKTILAVRAAAPDAIICVSTSGRSFKTFEQRSEVLGIDGPAKPEMASLTLGSMNFPKQASVNEPPMIRKLADAMNERGIVPELEVFDIGMLDYAKYLIERGVLREPFYFNLLLGSLGTLAATPFNLATMVMSLPAGSIWAGAGIGRFQFFVNSLSVVMGGHVRVGLEDNLFFDREKTRPATNPSLVERVAKLARAAERDVATPDEARAIIGLAQLAR